MNGLWSRDPPRIFRTFFFLLHFLCLFSKDDEDDDDRGWSMRGLTLFTSPLTAKTPCWGLSSVLRVLRRKSAWSLQLMSFESLRGEWLTVPRIIVALLRKRFRSLIKNLSLAGMPLLGLIWTSSGMNNVITVAIFKIFFRHVRVDWSGQKKRNTSLTITCFKISSHNSFTTFNYANVVQNLTLPNFSNLAKNARGESL